MIWWTTDFSTDFSTDFVFFLVLLLFSKILDVILGSGCNNHSGNIKFSQFIKAYKRARFRTNPNIGAGDAVKEV